ncbi:MAG: thioredoxin domain-containing protein [Syntrophales bacterium]|jgi:hypothetical protein|nr:thioredoxin domain-containing protein [Syntrophales bacterium]
MDEKSQNRLALEKSPYLLQHKNNPVDWFPWGEEAFLKAKGEGKPVFLSIGYSTCHWCHVMEHESFEDGEVARSLNDHYVAIKVDREERPDLDHIYMTVCQTLTGQGGWPLTIFLTPEQKPFFAGTYFPKRSKWGRSGLLDILEQITEKWTADRKRLSALAEEITTDIQRQAYEQPGNSLTADVLEKAYEALQQRFDPAYGGFGEAPKFPSPHNLMFLLRYSRMTGKPEAQTSAMVGKTLLAMYKGGIYDHVGYGFARYSTDRQWLTPHFEKMLYDNALLAYVYLEAHQAMASPFYARVAEEIFAYVAREMTSFEGGFYSAQDADSEGLEGKFYLWTAEEVERVLGKQGGMAFCRLYDITGEGNFEGANIPNLIRNGPGESASLFNLLEKMKAPREKLYQERKKRIHPHKDDKVLTSWNGLMIAALAKGSQALQNPAYAAVAAKAAGFIWERLRSPEGRLLARYRDGEAALPAYLDDYAFLAWGFIELYRATFNPDYLQKALELTEQMISLFWDEKSAAFFFSGKDAEKLIARPRTLEDGAVPSGNSVAALNLLRLSHLTGEQRFGDFVSRQMDFFAGDVKRFPQAYTFFLTALQFALGPPREIVVMAGNEEQEAKEILQALQKKFLPETALLCCPPGEQTARLKAIAPFLEQYEAIDGKATLYLCTNYACQAPVTGREQMQKIIDTI